MRGGYYTAMETILLLEYCANDVYALRDLWPRMVEGYNGLPGLNTFHPQEILSRGRFMVSLARSHRTGVPVDTPFLHDLSEYSAEIALAIATAAEAEAAQLAEKDPEHYCSWGIYDGARFTMEGYKDFLHRARIKVPSTKTGQPTTAGKELEKLEGAHPQLTSLRECMGSLDALSKFDLAIDADDHVRMFSRPFGAITGRSTKSVFSFPKWMRPMIKPPRNWGVAYLDAKAQEHLISGALSGDKRMIADYFAGDVHQKLVDELGLTEEHGQKPRDRAKIINHATNYGQKKWGLAKRLGISEEKAGEILHEHQQSRRRFYQWRQSIVNGLRRKPARTYFTKLGWPFWTGHVSNDRTMMNFPAQSHGADWMRVVMIAATEAGILVCTSAHDGFLIAAPAERLEADIKRMTLIMQASSEALFGMPMFVDCDENARAVWPDRLMLGGKLHPTWRLVQRELRRVKRQTAEMKQPTREEWIQRKAQRVQGPPGPRQSPETAPGLPEDLFLPDDYAEPAAAPEGSKRPIKRRQFRRFDETWAEILLAADPPASAAVWRLALVLLAEADFHREILIADDISVAARLVRCRKRETLERMEQLGLIGVEWRGRGRAARVVPRRLDGRPSRK